MAVVAPLLLALPVHALTLISEQEAGLPAPTGLALELRGVTRGPTITVVSPAKAAPAKSPLPVKILFEPHGGSTIDIASVKVTYLRSPAVDLTDRLRPFISARGIEVDDASIAPGRHAVRIDLKDAQGRPSSSILEFSVDR
ncbi:MAG: hypothetical protein JO021_04815 [Alphaproteobacteria bacterium]|nr:hypothetical protein [Alphaproteobacteria bacterium]